MKTHKKYSTGGGMKGRRIRDLVVNISVVSIWPNIVLNSIVFTGGKSK